MLRYFIYCRKSSVAEDRQVLSLESQLNELKSLSERLNLSVVNIFTESQSAKSPGRPQFNEMLKKISQKKADGIICWKLDRLARNPIDGGQIIWLLQKGIIKHIQTFDRGYSPEDNVLLMNVEFGMANQYILDLSKNVKRGLKTKVEKGWLPTLAPIGYLNDRSLEKGTAKIIKDPERFDLVKRMWDMMLTGNYTPPKIAQIANKEWGFKTQKLRPLAESTLYKIYINPFYAGWFEYPKNSGNWYKGSHDPMITRAEYDKVQILLGRKGKPRIKKHEFPFTGLIRCGECGAMVTAEQKNQIVCSTCKYKFSSDNKTECPKCKTPIEKMINPTIRRYVYYHCTKRINPECSQGSIEAAELEKQINRHLSDIHISEDFKDWSIKYLRKMHKEEIDSIENILASQRRAYDMCLKKLDNLFQLKISPTNINGSLLTDEEYGKQKAVLNQEKIRLEELLKDGSANFGKWIETGERLFDFACYAQYWFENASPQDKFEILKTLGSNLTLKDKKLILELHNPFRVIGEILNRVPETSDWFEPQKFGFNKEKLGDYYSKNLVVRRGIHKVRTWIWSHLEDFSVPSFGNEPG